MKIKTLLAIGAIILCNISYAQDSIIILHPVIGEIIDKEEKFNYCLFPEIKNCTYNYGSVIYLDTNYYVTYNHHDDSVSLLLLDSSEIINYRGNISKLVKYFASELNDSLEAKHMKSLAVKSRYSTNSESQPINIEEYRKEFLDEDRMLERWRYDTEKLRRMNECAGQFQQDLLMYDSYFRKKKKK